MADLKQFPVDQLLLKARTNEVTGALAKLGFMAAMGINADFFYFKSAMILSWRYFEMNAIDEGKAVLRLLTPDYVKDVLPRHLEEDPMFRQLATRIADKLVEVGEVKSVWNYDTRKVMPQKRGDA